MADLSLVVRGRDVTAEHGGLPVSPERCHAGRRGG
jgi:hypothetical protein